MNKRAVTKAQLKRSFEVAEKLGFPVAGLRHNPDGTIDMLFGESLISKPATANDDDAKADDGGWEAYDARAEGRA